MTNQYTTQVQWGGNTAPWNNAGTWTIGDRANQHIVDVKLDSQDNGNNLHGTVTYSGEGAVGFKANKINLHTFQVQYQWGGIQAPWNQGGQWVLGDRPNQGLIGVHINSTDNGKTFHGTIQYTGEGPVGFQATNI
jgi:hypothetical protein